MILELASRPNPNLEQEASAKNGLHLSCRWELRLSAAAAASSMSTSPTTAIAFVTAATS